MYDTILVPTDGSDHAEIAARHAAEFARRVDATIHVVAAADVQAAGGAFDAGGVDESFVEQLERRAAEDVNAASRAIGDDLAVTTARLRGRPDEAILDYAEDEGIDLIAMGTHGRTGVKRFVSGSVTERVLRRSEVPVLTARATGDDAATAYETILVPTDGSEAATAAVDHAVAAAEAFDATVHAVSVMDATVTMGQPDLSAPPGVIEAREEHAERAVDTVAERAREAGVGAETAVLGGSPASSILDHAEEVDADLIAMGTTGQTGLSRYLLGSTAERVIRHADAPVLAVNARE